MKLFKLVVVFVSLAFVIVLVRGGLFDSSIIEINEQCLNQCNEQFNLAVEQCSVVINQEECLQHAREQLNLCIASCGDEEAERQILCCVGDGPNDNCFQSTINQCREQGGAVMDCGLPEAPEGTQPKTVHDCNEERKQAFEACKQFKGIARALCMAQATLESQQCKKNIKDVTPTELRNFTITRQNVSDSVLVNLTRNVVSTGVNNSVYANGTYDCRSFASDLEKNLTAMGYNATWTAYWCYGGVGNPPVTAHAVTDVHLSDGRTVFIEPQTNQIVNLDFDGDGIVEVNYGGYVPGQNTGQTDDNCKISVFGDRAAAAAAGVPGA